MARGAAEELCDYLNVKSAKVTDKEDTADQTGVNGKIFKHWTNVWVVLHAEKSPSYSFIGHCKKESDWLSDNKIEKLLLGEPFEVQRLPVGYSKKYEHVLQVAFKSYQLDLAFDSMTKMDNWCKTLQAITDCYHVDLVRCPEHSELEGEYIVEVGSTHYKAWSFHPDKESKVKWEWQLKHIRRVHWHKNVHKLEVEPGRSSQTGEGHFYFTGQQSSRLFSVMRYMMTHRSSSSSSLTGSPPNSPLQGAHNNQMYHKVERVGVESEDDWTGGTGDDWTGTSDSGFFVGSKVPQPTIDGRNHFILPSGPAPPLPPGRPRETSHYTDLNLQTMDPDNQYVHISRQGHVYDTVPMEDGSTTPTNARMAHYQVPRPHIDPNTSEKAISRLSITDDYCQMSSVSVTREIRRNGSLPMERPPPVPPHQKGVKPPTAWAEPHSSAVNYGH